MGYRSNIGGVFSVDGWDGEPEDINKYKLKYKEMIGFIKLSDFYALMQKEVTDRNCIGWRAGSFYFNAEDWKWYSDYDVVQAWEELWKSMQNIEGISGYFLRVGEEATDVEQDQFGDEPDFTAFYLYTGMNCDVCSDVFGNGDIDKEFSNEAKTEKESTNATQPDCAGANHATQTQ
jgi:hypothetical protein